MTDLDRTEINPLNESSIKQNSLNASLQILSGIEPDTFQITDDVVIGRSSPSDIILFSPSLSNQHAKITLNNGQYFLTDLESSTKTFHNQVELQPNVCYALHHGDAIKFGDIACSFEQQNPSAPSTTLSTCKQTIDIDDAVKSSEINETSNNNFMIIENSVDEQANESPSMIIDEQRTDDTNEMDEEMTSRPTTSTDVMPIDQTPNLIAQPTIAMEATESTEETIPADVSAEAPALDDDAGESAGTSSTDGVARKNVRRARARRRTATRARPVSARRQTPIVKQDPSTLNTETKPPSSNQIEIKDEIQPTTMKSESNIRVSARIKERTSTGRNRQFPYADDYVDLDILEKQPKTNSTSVKTTRKSTRQRSSTSSPKRANHHQQPIDQTDNQSQMNIDTSTETKPTTRTSTRKRQTTIPTTPNQPVKRTRSVTPQTVPKINTRRKQTATTEQSSLTTKSTRQTTMPPKKRTRKSTKTSAIDQPIDRPVRIALSSHLNFDTNYLDTLRQLDFEILDETSPVDALVVDRIRRTKKFFICLARGAHILSPQWIETMVKENRYVSYEKFYLEDKTAETRYGFQLRESVRLAKQRPIFGNQVFFCTKDTAPPYDDLKDIIEAAGGRLIEKINPKKIDKDLICIVAQVHKNEYEDLFKKGLTIVSEEFILSGISKQKLDFDTFSLFSSQSK